MNVTAPETTRASGQARAETTTATDVAMLVIRLALGIIFLAHGSQKMLGLFGGPGFSATMDMFTHKMGIPAVFAFLAIFTEFFGGLAVLIGLLSRLASLGLIVTMLVAIATVHGKNGFFLQNQGFEYNFALIGLALAIVIAGPGRLAIADLESRLLRRKFVDASVVG